MSIIQSMDSATLSTGATPKVYLYGDKEMAREHIKSIMIGDIARYFERSAAQRPEMIASPEAKAKFDAQVAHLLVVAEQQPADFFEAHYGAGRTTNESVMSVLQALKPLLYSTHAGRAARLSTETK